MTTTADSTSRPKLKRSSSMAERPEASATAKPVKLRESCDSCLLAKVKCSKSRPLCSRCLSNGAPCDYSPSSRAGKRNKNTAKGAKATSAVSVPPDQSIQDPTSPLLQNTSYFTRLMYPLLGEEDRTLLMQNGGHIADGLPSPSILQAHSGLKMPMAETGVGMMQDGEGIDPSDFLPTPPFSQGDFAESFMPMSGAIANPFADFASSPTSPGISTDKTTISPAWTMKDNPYALRIPNFQSPLDLMPSISSHHAGQAASRSTTSIASPPLMPSAGEPNLTRSKSESHQSCDCFAACLQVTQSLHNHGLSASQQGGLPFDIVLTINREATDSCSVMLECSNCLNKSGRSISTMLLALIFGKIMSLYRDACFLRFGAATGMHVSAQLAFGAYTVTGENRQLLEIEILLLELRKVERVLQLYSERFHKVHAEKTEGDESEVYDALTQYLEKELRHIVNFLLARKSGASK